MRPELLFLGCSVLTACAIDLGSSSAVPDGAVSSVPALSGCLPLTRSLDGLEGRLDAQTLPDGSSLLVANQAVLNGVSTSRGFALRDPTEACIEEATPTFAVPLFDGAPLGAANDAELLGGVTTDTAYRFFLAADGIGISRFNPQTQRFEALAWLWTADRPSYGSAAAAVGEFVYVFGGLPARFLAADVYMARVRASQIEVAAAYEYWQGGGTWSVDADLAAPIFEGGVRPSVLFDRSQTRWLMAYTTPLATHIEVRSGLDVTGPWSQPLVLGSCDLPEEDPDSFCSAPALLPSSPGTVGVSYGVATFNRVTSNAAAYWTRSARTDWPRGLP